ncbi:hypothetical protein [Paraburkholderia sp.]|jgi:hypothetical protein|uniref:hypothetical protein n=1 Tax=Paraburkholderia sp. TaxID=1926495 RepID=UPI002F3F9DAE
MKTRLIAALLASVSVFAAAPVFASGYGPAPFYRASVGAPASQRGQNAETVSAERRATADAQTGYGGVAAGHSQSGSRMAVLTSDSLYAHH